jgi:hypothetical protein
MRKIGCIALLVLGAFFVLVLTNKPDTQPSKDDLNGIVQSVVNTATATTQGNAIVIDFDLRALDIDSMRFDALHKPVEISCALKEAGHTDRRHFYRGHMPVVDQFGNESTIIGVKAELQPDAVQRLNCTNVYDVDLSAIASIWELDSRLAG